MALLVSMSLLKLAVWVIIFQALQATIQQSTAVCHAILDKAVRKAIDSEDFSGSRLR